MKAYGRSAGESPAGILKVIAMLPGVLLTIALAGCGERASAPAPDSQSKEEVSVESTDSVDSGPIASTQHGKVRGFTEDGVLVFKGIRYGADTATTRFMRPQPPEPWEGTQDALAYGNSTRQTPLGGGLGLFSSWRTDPAPELSEDCLFLNVWTPALRDSAKRPVLVWFHGGGFSTGSGSSNAYDGIRLVNRGDVVVVTVNHRLNIFAHLYLAEYGEKFADSGNAGILDLIHSLKWVRENIAEFGGDPDNVLIFGESGGGMKVSVLMAMDEAQGLFHRAVIQSGPQLSNRPADAATAGGKAVVEQLGLTPETIDQILTLPPEKIEQAARDVVEAGGSRGWSGPVFDGVNFKRQPFAENAPEQSRDVPLLIGTTRTEMTLLAGARRPELFDLTWETLPAALETAIPELNASDIIAGYRELQPSIDAPELFFTAITDNGFYRRSRTLADHKADQGGAPVYFYLFDWNTPVDNGKWKATHALDIGFVFDNVAKSESMSGIGEEQQALADMMSESWLAFARVGDPNNPNLPAWKPYSSTERSTMMINVTPQLTSNPRAAQLDLMSSE